MSNIVTVGYITEGSTDRRFLETIIQKTVEEIALKCGSHIEVYDPIFLDIKNKDGYINYIVNAAKAAYNNGVFILCIHCDSDNLDDLDVFNHKINPALTAINEAQGEICKNLVPLIPITMSESWILADKELFKNEIGTTLSNEDLSINRHPETIADPKALIVEALRISQAHLPKRRSKLTISEIYQPMGQKLSIEKLSELNSFRKFKSAVEIAFRKLNYLT